MTSWVPINLSEMVLTTPGFDDLLLTGVTVDDDGNEFRIEALDADATWDNPQPIDTTVQRWLTDGAVASTQGHDNRSPYFKVLVSAGTSVELAAGEAALAKRAERIQRGEQIALLTWVTPEGRAVAPAAVFEIWTWHLEHTFDGLSERRLERMYGVRATAKPWVRSLELTEVDALTTGGAAPTTVSIDACTATTGWAGSATPTVVGGTALKVTQTPLTAGVPVDVWIQRTGSVTGMGTTPYLMIDLTTTSSTLILGRVLQVTVDGHACALVTTLGTVSYYQVPPGVTSFTTLKIRLTGTGSVGITQAFIQVADVSRTDTIGGVGSNKQLTRRLAVGGSVPTSGSLKVASPDATPLGTVLVYSAADSDSDYSPPMRQYRSTGNTVTPDTAAVSGNHEALVTGGSPAGTITFTVPAAQYAEGTYAIIGRFFATSTTTLTATIGAAIDGYDADSVSGKVAWATANTWEWGVIGALTLPPQPIPPESTVDLVVTLAGVGAGTITVDELYLLDVTHGVVSLVDCGAATRLWLNAPDADPVRNRPAIYLGTADDRSDAVHARYDQVLALGEHDLVPEGALLLTVTDGVNSALASASFYQRWHTQPAA